MRLWLALLLLIAPASALFCSQETIVEKPAQVSAQRQPLSVRLLVFKHSREYMADGDAHLAVNVANQAATRGLQIKVIGNHFFTDPVQGYVKDEFTAILMNPDEQVRLQRFQEWISQQMKIDAKPKDTLIIFSIGHGFPNGGLHNIGQRSDVMKALANAAQENNQQTIWWQLSCHASANLPAISTLPPAQQKLFSVIASSSAHQISADQVQGHIMDKLFTAMANKSTALDPNGDGLVTAGELIQFFSGRDIPHQGGGPILYAISADNILFGVKNLDIRIIDCIGPQGTYPEDYIPLP